MDAQQYQSSLESVPKLSFWLGLVTAIPALVGSDDGSTNQSVAVAIAVAGGVTAAVANIGRLLLRQRWTRLGTYFLYVDLCVVALVSTFSLLTASHVVSSAPEVSNHVLENWGGYLAAVFVMTSLDAWLIVAGGYARENFRQLASLTRRGYITRQELIATMLGNGRYPVFRAQRYAPFFAAAGLFGATYSGEAGLGVQLWVGMTFYLVTPYMLASIVVKRCMTRTMLSGTDVVITEEPTARVLSCQ